MLVFGTQLHLVTFVLVCIEIVIIAHLLTYRFIRPDIKETNLSLALITLLITYNITGGLFPDPNLPGSFFVQKAIAYGTGFITPCYFPYYVYKAFNLVKMKWHALIGVFIFLALPYVFFLLVFRISNNLELAKKLLIIPMGYATWVIYSLFKAIKFKYQDEFGSKESTEEIVVLFTSLTPWVALPIVDYFNTSQVLEATITNVGFLLLLSLQVKRHIIFLRKEHDRLKITEERLSNWTKTHSKREGLIKEFETVQPINLVDVREAFERQSVKYNLTRREKEIIKLITQGYTYKSIGSLLYISERTVNKHVQNIFEKVDVSNKIELIKKLHSL